MNNFSILRNFTPLLAVKNLDTSIKRTAVVLKRRFPYRLHKKNEPPKNFRNRDFVYSLVDDDYYHKKPDVDVILLSYVEGLGKPGDQVAIRPIAGYNKYLCPGLAVYATPENIEKYSKIGESLEATIYSSKYSFNTLKRLRASMIGVKLNDTQPWTLEPWHIRMAFRMNGFIVPEDTIEMPKRTISGPYQDQHRKDFYVTVTISEQEKAIVRCRLYLIGIKTDAVPDNDWLEPAEPLFEEDRSVLAVLPKPEQHAKTEFIRFKQKKK